MSGKKISAEKKKKLKTLVKLMNKQNERLFPPFPPLLDMLNLVLDDTQLDFLLLMGTEPYTHDEAASKCTLPTDDFEHTFLNLCEKGFILMRRTEDGGERYVLNAILVGWIEAQVLYLRGRPEEKEFARKFYGEYITYMKKFAGPALRNLQNTVMRKVAKPHQSVGIVEESVGQGKRTVIEVNQTLSREDSKIYPTRTVNELIEEYGNKNQMAQLPCMCRHSYKILDEPCRFDIPENGGCLIFGPISESYVKYGHAHYISKEEAFEIIREVRDKGAIHSVFHERDDTDLPEVGICNCCWDCCGLLRSYNYGASTLKYDCYFSAYIKDNTRCIGCGLCEKFCPTTAARVVDKKVVIDEKRCIGCGQCVHQCPVNDVLELKPNVRTVFLPILNENEIRIHA